jgi:hypothetical protein
MGWKFVRKRHKEHLATLRDEEATQRIVVRPVRPTGYCYYVRRRWRRRRRLLRKREDAFSKKGGGTPPSLPRGHASSWDTEMNPRPILSCFFSLADVPLRPGDREPQRKKKTTTSKHACKEDTEDGGCRTSRVAAPKTRLGNLEGHMARGRFFCREPAKLRSRQG